jgi:hypothetical protein
MSSDDLANLYKMLNVLVSPDGGADRKLGEDEAGRKELCDEKHYNVDHKEPPPGYHFVHYQDAGEFNAFIDSIISTAIQTMTGEEVRDPIDGGPPSQRPWATTDLFDMLHKLRSDEPFKQSFHQVFLENPDETQQKEWLNANLPNNSYHEHEAITALMARSDHKAIKDTINGIISSFYKEYRFCC